MDDESVEDQLSLAGDFAERAVQFDGDGSHEAAIYLYTQAAGALLTACRLGAQVSTDAGEGSLQLQTRAHQYLSRAEALTRRHESESSVAAESSRDQQAKERVAFILSQALSEDERANSAEALDLYSQAVELYLTQERSDSVQALRSAIEQAMSRAEYLKSQLRASAAPSAPLHTPPPDRHGSAADTSPRQVAVGGADPVAASASSHQLSGEEMGVLAATSRINGRVFVPFIADADAGERFCSSSPFSDPDGLLPLSQKQRQQLHEWRRPSQLYPEPCVIKEINCFTIRQTCVSDCSFVASLAVSALYEKRFSKSLITSIIYPRSRHNVPVYNPCGKYMVRLHVNGVSRKVVIDDLLPVDKFGRLLCSFSTKHELWVSVLEKAYMKVMGGYDFPGSNSGIDLHALTGWIPERQNIGSTEAEPNFNADHVFRKMFDHFHKGNLLATVATGQIPQALAEKSGLVPCHAYAVLDVREVQGRRLLLLKNPWSHVRWRGRYSELDGGRWTAALQHALGYNPRSAANFDNGVFWIDYDSVLHHFDVFYFSWRPQLFVSTACFHSVWQAGTGPIRDNFNIGENPQYKLQVGSPSVVWLLLTRHITEISDFRDNREFITVVVYKSNGNAVNDRVFYPNDPAPYLDGVRINSPHYLCRLTLGSAGDGGAGGERCFTLVVAQYEKLNTIYYTLRAFSAAPFSLKQIPPLPVRATKSGVWRTSNAGGCSNYPATYHKNSVFKLQLTAPADVTLQLKGPKEYQVGMDVVSVSEQLADPQPRRRTTNPFRSGFVVLCLGRLPAGVYHVTPSTFTPGQLGPFLLSVLAPQSHCCHLSPL